MGAVNEPEPDYLSVADGGGGDEDEPGLPPRASLVSRAVDPLKRVESGDADAEALPGPPPRASLVSRAMARLVSRASDLPSDPQAAVASEGDRRPNAATRAERRAMRRAGGGWRGAIAAARGHDDGPTSTPVRADSELNVPPPPPSASDIAAAVRNL